MKKTWWTRVSLAAAVMLGAGQAAAVVYRVAPGGAGVSTTWALPGNLQATLAMAGPGDTVWAAAGTYKPGPLRTDTFLLDGEVLLGGFPPAGGPLISRDPSANITVLDGDIGVAGDPADNSYHVVFSWTGTLDGFVVQHGTADGTGAGDSVYGGGVYVRGATTIDRCTIVKNQAGSGGGVYFLTNQAGVGLDIFRTTIIDNHALGPAGMPALLGNGGGVFTESQEDYKGVLTMNRCSLLGNTAAALGGGVSSNMDTNITNTVFSGNFANGPGGGLWVVSLPGPALGKIHNCTFANNSTNYGLGAGGAHLSHNWVANSIFWNNTAAGGTVFDQQIYGAVYGVEYTDTEGGPAPGAGNISALPVFINELGADGVAGTIDDNLRIRSSSPCVDVGNNAVAANPYDRVGNNRIRVGKIFGMLVVDMGAYERGLFDPVAPGDINFQELDPVLPK